MNMPIAIWPLANRVPGRLHLALNGLETDPGWAERLEHALILLPGLHDVCASIASGSLLLRYDPSYWNTESLVSAIGAALDRPCRLTPPGPIVNPTTPLNQSLAFRWLHFDGRILDATRPLPSRHRQAEWSQVDSDTVGLGLRIGALCFAGSQPDKLSRAFAQVARCTGMPVDDWLAQYRPQGQAIENPFLICFRRRGHQTFGLARGDLGAVISQCAFYQDREGCHPLTGRLREELESQGTPFTGTVALAYRPLLYQQSTLVPIGDWIYLGFGATG